MAMLMTPMQAGIREAFSNRSLMGLRGFDGGCGCGSLEGFGATEYGDTGSGEGETRPPNPPTGNPCDDTSLWAIKKGVDGKCWNYCVVDITQQGELDASYCAVGNNTKGKVKPKTMDMNIMIIGGIALGAIILMRQ